MFLIGIILLVLFFVLRIVFKDNDKLKVSPGPELTPDQKAANYKSVRTFLENNPDLRIKDHFPEYVKDIETTRKYNELNRQFEAGQVSYADYQIELNELIKDVKISL